MKTYTPAQLAKDMQVGRGTVMTLIKSGKLAAYNVAEGKAPRYRITQDAVETFLDSRRVKTAPKIQLNRRITNRTTKDYFANT